MKRLVLMFVIVIIPCIAVGQTRLGSDEENRLRVVADTRQSQENAQSSERPSTGIERVSLNPQPEPPVPQTGVLPSAPIRAVSPSADKLKATLIIQGQKVMLELDTTIRSGVLRCAGVELGRLRSGNSFDVTEYLRKASSDTIVFEYTDVKGSQATKTLNAAAARIKLNPQPEPPIEKPMSHTFTKEGKGDKTSLPGSSKTTVPKKDQENVSIKAATVNSDKTVIPELSKLVLAKKITGVISSSVPSDVNIMGSNIPLSIGDCFGSCANIKIKVVDGQGSTVKTISAQSNCTYTLDIPMAGMYSVMGPAEYDKNICMWSYYKDESAPADVNKIDMILKEMYPKSQQQTGNIAPAVYVLNTTWENKTSSNPASDDAVSVEVSYGNKGDTKATRDLRISCTPLDGGTCPQASPGQEKTYTVPVEVPASSSAIKKYPWYFGSQKIGSFRVRAGFAQDMSDAKSVDFTVSPADTTPVLYSFAPMIIEAGVTGTCSPYKEFQVEGKRLSKFVNGAQVPAVQIYFQKSNTSNQIYAADLALGVYPKFVRGTVPAAVLNNPGWYAVYAVGNGKTSNPIAFEVRSKPSVAPEIVSVDPEVIDSDAAGYLMNGVGRAYVTITGKNFSADTKVSYTRSGWLASKQVLVDKALGQDGCTVNSGSMTEIKLAITLPKPIKDAGSITVKLANGSAMSSPITIAVVPKITNISAPAVNLPLPYDTFVFTDVPVFVKHYDSKYNLYSLAWEYKLPGSAPGSGWMPTGIVSTYSAAIYPQGIKIPFTKFKIGRYRVKAKVKTDPNDSTVTSAYSQWVEIEIKQPAIPNVPKVVSKK